MSLPPLQAGLRFLRRRRSTFPVFIIAESRFEDLPC